jgi:hypothetical protein
MPATGGFRGGGNRGKQARRPVAPAGGEETTSVMRVPVSALRSALTGGLLLALAGCGGGLGGLTGGDERPRTAATGGGVLDIFGFRGAQAPQAPQAALDPLEDRELTCPPLELLDGGAALRVGQPGSASQVSHQISINEIARECRTEGGTTVAIRVGVAGRVLIGPLGKPGTFTVPLRLTVRTGNNPTTYRTVSSRFVRVAVTVPPNETAAEYVHVEAGISVPIGARDPGEEYTIVVGLDPRGGQPERPARRR